VKIRGTTSSIRHFTARRQATGAGVVKTDTPLSLRSCQQAFRFVSGACVQAAVTVARGLAFSMCVSLLMQF
jgi:hypothetical protein